MPFSPRLAALLLATALPLAAMAQETASDTPAVTEAPFDGDAGAYLAARSAANTNDYRAVAEWQARALAADPDNPLLLQPMIVASAAIGDFPTAAIAAQHLKDLGQGLPVGDLVLMTQKAAAGDYAGILAEPKDLASLGALTSGLVTGWAEFGNGRMSEAQEAFDAVAADKGLEAFGLYHKALALAAAGDFEGADAIFSGKAAGPINLNRRGIIAHAEILSQLERNADALARLDEAFGTDADPAVESLRSALKAGQTLPFDVVSDAKDGIAEVLFTVATALNGQADDSFTLLYTRAAAQLDPTLSDATLLAGGLLEQQDQYDLAIETYSLILPEDPNATMAQIGIAGAEQSKDMTDAAIARLTALASSHPRDFSVHLALGDALRRAERYAEAVPAYDTAIALIADPQPAHWTLFYSRGVAEERAGLFDASVADLKKALELAPNQPQVLNYLGYSWIDRGENLDEAMAMIQKAVEAEPETGYIIDSLAWAYFRTGKYQEALEPMERASLLEPVDPIVTDHLGDVYWMNGRKVEARYQWRRALAFEPTEKDAARIQRKLEVGLDVVMQEEAGAATPAPATPAAPATADGG